MLYDVYLEGTAEYIGNIEDRTLSLWKVREVRELLYRGRRTNFIIISTDQLSDRVTTVVARVVVDEAAWLPRDTPWTSDGLSWPFPVATSKRSGIADWKG